MQTFKEYFDANRIIGRLRERIAAFEHYIDERDDEIARLNSLINGQEADISTLHAEKYRQAATIRKFQEKANERNYCVR